MIDDNPVQADNIPWRACRAGERSCFLSHRGRF